MSILLPFTIGLPPISAMYLFIGIMGSAPFGGAVTSILFNIPGEPTSAASCFDGYPMTRRGEAAKALGIAAAAALFGALFGIVVLIALIPMVRAIVYAFGPPEFFMLLMFGLATVAIAAPGNTVKGLVTAGLGMLLSVIGYDPITGVLRFGFGSNELSVGRDQPAGIFRRRLRRRRSDQLLRHRRHHRARRHEDAGNAGAERWKDFASCSAMSA